MPRDMQILIAADDTPTVSALAASIVTRLDADITVVDSLSEARRLAAGGGYDVVLAAASLNDGPGESLIREDGPPVILIDRDTDAHRTISHLRSGAADVIGAQPDSDEVVSNLRRIIHKRRRRMHTVNRNRRLRRISRKLLRDRRDLRRRVDVICRDLVEAYQRLAQKVTVASGAGQTDPDEFQAPPAVRSNRDDDEPIDNR